MYPSKKTPKPREFYEKEWFIIVENRQEGPYSIFDLKRDSRFTPDTLVWKKGFKEWIPARIVKEIEEAFLDEPPSQTINEPFKGKSLDSDLSNESLATLTMQQDPYQMLLWILIVLLIILYIFYQIFEK